MGHVLKFLLLRDPDMLQLLQLNSLLVDCLLQVVHAQRRLSCIFVLGVSRLLHSPRVLIHVPLVKTLDILDGIFTDVELLSKLLHFNSPCRKELVAVLAFFEKLDHSAAETVEVFQHDQSLDVREGLLGAVVKSLGG